MRYTWTIRTGDVWYAGTDANVFLSLNGLDAVMKEVEISDANTTNDWEKGDTNTGSIETEDLGELQTGLLRSDQSGASSGWFVDWIKVRNEEDGREWTSQLGAWSDQDGRNGRFRLRFSLSDTGDFERIQKQKAAAAKKLADKEAADKSKSDADSAEQKRARDAADAKARDAQADDDFQRSLDEANRALERELKKARLEAELAKKRQEIEKLKNPEGTGAPNVPAGSGGMGGTRTLELFGMMGGARVPLASVVSVDRVTGAAAVIPGGRVLVGDSPADGFGLGGYPGRWQMYYPGHSPAEFGLDADKAVMGSDGSRGWALDARFLSQVFGSGWRMAVYS